MKKLSIGLSIIAMTLLFLVQCKKEEQFKTSQHYQNLDLRSEGDGIGLPINNWENGSYLVFTSGEDIASQYEALKVLLNDESNIPNYTNDENGQFEETCQENPALDVWESTHTGFVSMRRGYELYECDMLDATFEPRQIKDVPIIDDALATLISPTGLVQVGNEIQFFSGYLYAKAPISQKARLRDIINGDALLNPQDLSNGFDIQLRGDPTCEATFKIDLNHGTKTVHVTYTGSPLSGGDKSIVWDVEGSNNHKNETAFSHQYSSLGRKTICVTYSEYKVVPDTTYTYTMYEIDSTVVNGDGTTTVIKVKKFTKHEVVNQAKRLVCSSTDCKTIDIGQCNPDFDFVEGHDNIITFTNKSSVPFGTITGYLWQFGDGTTSTLVNPTHTYACDGKFEVVLIIYSAQCLNGQASTSDKVEATGINCCDKNPQSTWKEKPLASDKRHKKIEYRYDMGTNWNWLFDQDFKGKIKYYEYRRGCCIYNKKTKWRKTKGTLDVDFNGDVFAKDEDNCVCQVERTLMAQPANTQKKDHTFIDKLSSSAFGTDKTHWVKETSPVLIEYRVNGDLYLTQNCVDEPGFHCE